MLVESFPSPVEPLTIWSCQAALGLSSPYSPTVRRASGHRAYTKITSGALVWTISKKKLWNTQPNVRMWFWTIMSYGLDSGITGWNSRGCVMQEISLRDQNGPLSPSNLNLWVCGKDAEKMKLWQLTEITYLMWDQVLQPHSPQPCKGSFSLTE